MIGSKILQIYKVGGGGHSFNIKVLYSSNMTLTFLDSLKTLPTLGKFIGYNVQTINIEDDRLKKCL